MQGEELSKETIKAIQTLREKGMSVRKTALILHVGTGSVMKHGPVETSANISIKTKKDRDNKLEKIIDLSGERLVEVLESKDKIGPVALNTVMGTAWDKLYGKDHTPAGSPAHVLIQLFGRGGVGEKIARNLTHMLPVVEVIDTTAVDVPSTPDEAGVPAVSDPPVDEHAVSDGQSPAVEAVDEVV